MTSEAEKSTKEYSLADAPFSWDKLDGLLAHKSSLLMCSDILDCPESTIQNHIKKRYGLSFTEYANKKLSRTKVRLVQKALEQASSGNTTMLIFCLKNLCKWSDRNENTIELTNNAINLAYKLKETDGE